jgi:hypothetical protein
VVDELLAFEKRLCCMYLVNAVRLIENKDVIDKLHA